MVAPDVVGMSGLRRSVAWVVVGLAVGYPLATAVVRGLNPPVAFGGDTLALAARPFFDVVYAESLPFMIAAAGIGLVSPGIGILFMAVFIPSDLLASAAREIELRSLPQWEPWPAALIGRASGWLLLWVLVVEIPTRVRQETVEWSQRRAWPSSSPYVALTAMGVTAILVYLWALALPWLIKPTFTWAFIQSVNPNAISPIWYYWAFLVIAAVVVAGISTRLWPWAVSIGADETARPMAEDTPVRQAVQQVPMVAVVTLLLLGLVTTVTEAAFITAGLALAGPVLTLVLARMPIPPALARAPRAARWVIALVVAVAVSLLIILAFGPTAFATDYLPLAMAFAVAAPLFRVVAEAGSDRGGGGRTPARRPSTGVTTSALLIIVAAAWLALPGVALADNCSDTSSSELPSCAASGAAAGAAMAAAGAAAAGAALAAKRRPRRDPGSPQRWAVEDFDGQIRWYDEGGREIPAAPAAPAAPAPAAPPPPDDELAIER